METVYKKLFYFDLVHPFYTSGKSNDFRFHALPDTDSTLRRHHSIFHGRSNSPTVLSREKSPGTPMVTMAAGTELFWGMQLLNVPFVNYTAQASGTGNITCYINVNLTTGAVLSAGNDPMVEAGGLLTAVKARTAGTTIYHTLVSNDNIKLRLKDPRGNELWVRNYIGMAGKEIAVPVPAGRNGLFAVEEDNGAPGTPAWYFVHEALFGSSYAGIIQLITPTFLYDGNEFFRITFAAKEVTWKYYFVSRAMSAADMITRLRVIDNGYTSIDDLHTEITFTDPAALADGDPVGSVFNPGDAIVAVTSEAPVAYREKPRKKIELQDNSLPRIENLSNPDPSGPDAIMIIQV